MAIERVLLAGASGRTGQQALHLLSQTSIEVTAMTRSEATADRLRHQGATEVVVGDLMNRDDAGTAVEGVDAVITAVGSSPLHSVTGDEFVDGTGNINLVEAAGNASVETIVMVSSLGVGGDRNSWLARSFRLAIRPVVEAKTRAEAAIRESGLRYTIFRPGVLTRWGPGSTRVADAGAGLWGAVPRTALAQVLVAAPFTPAAADRTLEVVANPLLSQQADIDWNPPV